MVYQKEIADIAEKKGVTKSTVDKDWVLGHFVNAIFGIESLKNELIFKGGTCLKKCYFGDYRFSEDLDFTAFSIDFELNQELLAKICKEVETNSGVKLHINELRPLQYDGIKTGYQAEIKFWGADHSKNQPPAEPVRWQTKIKIETILYEKMLFDGRLKAVIHNYSDADMISHQAVCYDLREVMSEKLRAMLQRTYTAPRDYYDVWYLSKHQDFDWVEIKHAFLEKMAFKNLKFNSINDFINEKIVKTLDRHWATSLGAHLPEKNLPSSAFVVRELKELLGVIFRD